MSADAMELGPVDIVVIGYPPDAPKAGDAVPIFLDLVDRGIIRVLDVAGVQKNEDGTFDAFLAADIDGDGFPDLAAFSGASTGLLAHSDLSTASDDLEPGTAAILIVYENRWAAPFVAAVRRNGGEVLAFERVPAADLLDALDALDEPETAA
ncbi:DUF6325 family protein [Capillimicrobium parvum]|uniref:DUF1269 domain-containing family protein n=1 Tax=Capillimicrobium parvum TaxID=2884022 RepID=A0A9E7BZU0_9ACTN|nr:DUF6325 family protein [Capillimicrobium parvum]UGS35671.1 hypothetical protein DSM104329_02066 [Capillimicrobium parvum]